MPEPITLATLVPGHYIRAYVNANGECAFHDIEVIGEPFDRPFICDGTLPAVMSRYSANGKPRPYYLTDLGVTEDRYDVALFVYSPELVEQLNELLGIQPEDNRAFTEFINRQKYTDFQWAEATMGFRLSRQMDRMIDRMIDSWY